jgi:hypothetical protein
MATSTWDFKKLVVAYAGQTLSGFAGDISIDPDGGEDVATKTVGSDGTETVVVFHNNTSGSVTVAMMASSASNDVLSALAAAKTVGPIMIRDTNGRTVLEAPAAWVARRPVVAYGAEMSEREWRIDYSDAKFVIGGLAQVS